MAEPALKFPDRVNPEAAPAAKPAPRRRLRAALRKYRRPLLLVVLPLVLLAAGVALYLSGGRFVSTDDAYVGAQKVLITPDVAGKIVGVSIKEGQLVQKGDALFQIDPVPYRLAVQQAEAKLADARTSHANLVANVKLYGQTLELANAGVALKQRDVERKSTLVKSSFGSQLELDNAAAALVTAQSQLQFVKQQRSTALNQLLGDPDLPLEKFPAWLQAKAALEDAQRNLELSTVRAPIDGTATQVDNIQIGRSVAAGAAVFSIVNTAAPWVDANLKESDFTHIAAGQTVTMQVDAFPDHAFKGTVGSLSPGTGAQFAILPPQNATGNFVKVVQRVPVRIYFDPGDPMVTKLKAGMSTVISIDTRHRRSLARLLGLSRANAEP